MTTTATSSGVAAGVAYTRRGTGPPLVLLHPLGADRQVWAPVMDALAAVHDVVAFDLPGFGDSPPLRLPDGWPPTPARLAEGIAAALDALELRQPAVAGNSLGGWVALELALRGYARTVTAIAPAGLWPRALGPKPSAARTIARRLLPVLPTLLRAPSLRALALLGTVAHPRRVPADAAFRLVRAYATATDFAAVNAAMRAGTFTRLGDVAVPVTLGWPARDRLVSRPRDLPLQIRSVVLEGAGHVPMWDDPDAVATLLLEGAAA